jgi:YD repeat-containing protein
MSDREKAGLHGPVQTCIEDFVYPTGKYSIATEYNIDGKLLSSRSTNADGSLWVTTQSYDPEGRLTARVSGKLGEPGLESLYLYDDLGRLLSITNNLRKGDRIDFHYDAQGRKTSIQSFASESLQVMQNAAFGGSPWDAAQMGMGVPVGGSVTTSFDQNDQPSETQVLDAQGQLVSRVVRTYGPNGQLSQEKPDWINPASLLLDRMPAEQRGQASPEQIKQLSKAMASVMAGQAPAGTTYTYDSQNRLTATRERNMMFDQTTSIAYNEQGDKAEERKTYAENSIIPAGVEFSVGEDGAVIPNKPSAQQPPQPSLPEPTVIKYTYQYDAYGNWTQQTATHTVHPQRPPTARNRTITYY